MYDLRPPRLIPGLSILIPASVVESVAFVHFPCPEVFRSLALLLALWPFCGPTHP